MMPPLVDAQGEEPERDSSVNVKRLFLDWSGVLAIAVGAVMWGTTVKAVESNSHEIDRLRAINEARAAADVRLAADMATKSDVQRVSDQVQALSMQIRRQNTPDGP